MLVLTRKSGEKVAFGGGITVTVVEVTANQVRLGIEAPERVRILRGELARRPDDPLEADRAGKPG
jgi:carbon storage regulator